MKFYRTPWFTKALYPSITFSRACQDSIYLTFDDGPSPIATPWVLEQLKKVEAKATFFCVGKRLRDYPEVANQVVRAGHVLGNHTYRHLKGWSTATARYKEDVEKTEKELQGLCSSKRLFRPPHGKITRRQLGALRGFDVIFWSHMSYDYQMNDNVERSIKELKRAKPGSILLFHDSEKALPRLKQILPELLFHYRSQGIKMTGL